MLVTVKGLKSGNFNSNFYSFSMASKRLAIGLYEMWAHGVCFAKPPLKVQNFENSDPQKSERPWEYLHIW
jgi:hypothetical protein